MSKSKHVVPNSKGGWSVRSAGASRAARTFDSQSEAVAYARDAARANHSELYIHRRDGTISDRRSYGRDPFPPKG
ncbi:DUF2188 domain-containing protein [Pararhizobium qamdonense]|uniref:DUF2188 domain-containing protein n=1 Tax=Pararhizobium qamdonense TaxID=3031126 RepID=UPI0023E190C4|nr:DUF2188 domain-containing protein [Pararhizobium qamdonense]